MTTADVRQLAYSNMSDDQIAEYEVSLELNMAFSASDLGRIGEIKDAMKKGGSGWHADL